MLSADDRAIVSSIASRAAHLLFLEPTQEAASKVRALMHRKIMYKAAVAQARCVTPPEGWDPFGR